MRAWLGHEFQPQQWVALTQLHPSRLLFHPGRTQAGALRVPSTPIQIQAPLSDSCSYRTQDAEQGLKWEVTKPGLLVLLEYFVPHSLILISTHHAMEVDSAVARIQIWV